VTIRLALAAAALLVAAPAFGQALDQQPTRPIADLLGEGFAVIATSTNGRPGEVVTLLKKDAKHYACTLVEFRGAGYSDPKAKPAVTPCWPLN
jgi:hypothetical protein